MVILQRFSGHVKRVGLDALGGRSHFPQRGDLTDCKRVWYDGEQKPPVELLPGEQIANKGLSLIVNGGTLYSPGD